MASFLAMLAQQAPNLRTRKALLVTCMQHDFISPHGKLPVMFQDGHDSRLEQIVTEFRKHGDVIWVRSEFESTRLPSDMDEAGCNVIASTEKLEAEQEAASFGDLDLSANRKVAAPRSQNAPSESKQAEAGDGKDTLDTDYDPELFLTKSAARGPCCIPGTKGAEFDECVKSLVQATDLKVIKSYYSAFSSSNLLTTLRSKLITELYICGCMTNISVYATAMDAARYGIKVVLVEDLLGYRTLARHGAAIRKLVRIMGAKSMTSQKAMERVRDAHESDDESYDSEESASDETEAAPTIPRAANTLEVDSEDEDEEYEDDELIRSVRTPVPVEEHPLRLEEASGLPYITAEQKDDSSVRATPDRLQERRVSCSSRQADSSQGETQAVGRSKGENVEEVMTTDLSMDASSYVTEPAISSHLARPRPGPLDALASEVSRMAISNITALVKSPSERCHTATRKANRKAKWREIAGLVERPSSLPLFGADKEKESVSSKIVYDLLPADKVDGLFMRLMKEVEWQTMHHQTGEVPRLVCCQGTIESDGSMPVYRHPADETVPLAAWTEAVGEIRVAAEAIVGHELNHALVQLYRGGQDHISEHSDKTIDVVPQSRIVNVSFGAERIMRLRTKRPVQSAEDGEPTQRTTYRIRMPHNSALIMSLATNAEYLHGINPDKRREVELSAAEQAYSGQRISLTFRQIGTFIDANSALIWGQGATGKVREDANKTINGNVGESAKLVRAFGMENQASDIRWEEWYGGASDVLHLK